MPDKQSKKAAGIKKGSSEACKMGCDGRRIHAWRIGVGGGTREVAGRAGNHDAGRRSSKKRRKDASRRKDLLESHVSLVPGGGIARLVGLCGKGTAGHLAASGQRINIAQGVKLHEDVAQ